MHAIQLQCFYLEKEAFIVYVWMYMCTLNSVWHIVCSFLQLNSGFSRGPLEKIAHPDLNQQSLTTTYKLQAGLDPTITPAKQLPSIKHNYQASSWAVSDKELVFHHWQVTVFQAFLKRVQD